MPFAALMPHVSVLVSNGGYGGLHYALAHGVPLVLAGATEEKPELVRRVNRSGVGVGIRTQHPRPDRLRAAVRQVLARPEYASRAAAIEAEMTRYHGPARAANLLEELATTRAPVLSAAAHAPSTARPL